MENFGIGAPVKRREDLRLLTGQGRYAEDCDAPGQAYAAFRALAARARGRRRNPTRGALAVAGVLGVLTGRDLAGGGVGAIPTLIAERGGGIRSRTGRRSRSRRGIRSRPTAVRHVGEPIAIVVAAGSAAARDGAEAVVVRYAPRPAVVDAVAALASGVPQLHDGVAGNRVLRLGMRRRRRHRAGDRHGGARHPADARRQTGFVTCFLEPRRSPRRVDAATGRYTLHAGLQSVHQLAANLARVLGVRRSRSVRHGRRRRRVRLEDPALSRVRRSRVAARHVGRPLKWVSGRSEGFVSDVQSRTNVLEGELALDANGPHHRAAGPLDVEPRRLRRADHPDLDALEHGAMISSLYAIPLIHLRVEGALTNTVPINVYRGVGRVECVYTVERLIGAPRARPDATRWSSGAPTWCARSRTARRPAPSTTRATTVARPSTRRSRRPSSPGSRPGRRVGAPRPAARHRPRAIYRRHRRVPQEFAEVRVLPTGIVEAPIGSNSQGQATRPSSPR